MPTSPAGLQLQKAVRVTMAKRDFRVHTVWLKYVCWTARITIACHATIVTIRKMAASVGALQQAFSKVP